MRRRWMVLVLIALLGGAAAWGSARLWKHAPPGRQAGHLVVTPAELDVQSDTPEWQSVELRLKNAGTVPLTIREVRTPCGCTLAAPLERDQLRPGEQTVLRVQVQPPGFGTRETVISLLTDSDTVTAVHVPVRLSGKVLNPPYVREWPDQIRHSTLQGGELEIPFFVLCLERSDEPPWLTGFRGESSLMTVIPPVVLSTHALDETTVYREYESVVRVVAPEPDGPVLTNMLRLETRTEASRPLPRIPVSVSRQAAVRAIPSTLLVRRDRMGDSDRRRVALVCATGEDWQVVAVEPSVPWVTAEIGGETSGGWLLEVEVPAEPPEDVSQASVRIETTHPGCPELSVSLVLHD